MKSPLENLSYFSQIISKEDESSILLLRVHLLIEENLREYLSTVFDDSNCILKAGLSFKQVMQLAKGIKNEPELKWFWDAVIMLNKIRNSMAHNLKTEMDHDKFKILLKHIRETGMSHIGSEGIKVFHPVIGPLGYLYNQSCVLAHVDTGFFTFKSQKIP